MDGPILEIDPSRFIFVLGPSFTSGVLHQSFSKASDDGAPFLNTASSSRASVSSPPTVPGLDVKGMVNVGIALLLESGQFQTESERTECEHIYRSALERDPLMKLSSSLLQCGRYTEWLERCFRLDAVPVGKRAPVLSYLVQLLDSGALLLYTGCDEVLSKLANLQVLLPQEKEAVMQWASGVQRARGILHVHGVFWKPDSLQLNCEVYNDPSHPARPAMEHVAAIFKGKYVISLGVCDPGQISNPMMANFARTFLATASNRHCFNLTMDGNFSERNLGLLDIPLVRNPRDNTMSLNIPVIHLSETSRLLCKQIEFSSAELQDQQLMALLVSGKPEALEIAKMMFSSPGVNFALMSSVNMSGHTAYTVSVRVESAKLGELWAWLWKEKKALLLSLGLLAVVMQTGTVVWVRGSPRGLPVAENHILKQPKQEFSSLLMEVPPPTTNATVAATTTIIKPNPKLLSPLVRQEFSIPKQGMKKIPRYTPVTKFPMKSGVGTSFTLPPGNGLSKVHHLHGGFSDDTNMYSQLLDLPKILERRSSLPPNIITTHHGLSSDSVLCKLAESCQGVSSELSPPSYTAIKQALLCDKYKRRQSMQTDPKTLKNLLQTKLVISDRNDDLVNMRRKSDPGSYIKQRDFERRKELFLDENMSWSKLHGHVIDQHIQRWQKKRQQKLQRDFLQWQQAELASNPALNPLKLSMLNPLLGPQVNPLAGQNPAAPALFPGAFLNAAATTGGVVSPYILPQGIVPGGSSAATNTPIYYNPFGTQYALVSPYPSLQLGQMPQSAAYVVPHTTTQPSVYYYIPTVPPTTSSVAAAAVTTPLTLGTTSSVPMTTMTVSSSSSRQQHGSLNPNDAPVVAPPANINLYTQPTINTAQAPSPPASTHMPRPVSPNSRKRHQSVPEKLTSLLQPPPVLPGPGGRISPMAAAMETNPDSPPSSKKQRSTSDTVLYHTPYGFSLQYSPGSRQSHSPHSHSVSPQPPPAAAGGSFEGLSALQTHLLQVHQSSYAMGRTAQEERQRRRNRTPNKERGGSTGHSPRRKHSGGILKSGSMSPASVQSNEGEEPEQMGEGQGQGQSWGVGEVIENRASVGGGVVLDREEKGGGVTEERRETVEKNIIKVEDTGPENNNNTPQLPLWQFLLELLVTSDTDYLHWTDNEFEFQMTKPTEVSQLWGQFTCNNSMSYDKLYSSLKCYFNQGIMSQVQGRKLTFKFAGHIRNYVQRRRSQTSSSHEEVVVV